MYTVIRTADGGDVNDRKSVHASSGSAIYIIRKLYESRRKPVENGSGVHVCPTGSCFERRATVNADYNKQFTRIARQTFKNTITIVCVYYYNIIAVNITSVS